MRPLVKCSLSIFCLISCVGILSAQSNTEKVSTYFEQIQNNEALLNHFFMKMPKGGDLHNHLTGSAYAETYFTLAVDDQLWVDMNTGKLYKTKPANIETIHLTKDMPDLHNVRMKLIDLWSVRNFQPYKSGLGSDEYFFGTFGLFAAVSDNHLVDLLKELKLRAAKENVQYLEIMLTSPKVDTLAINNAVGQVGFYGKYNTLLSQPEVIEDATRITPLLAQSFAALEKSPAINKIIDQYVAMVDSIDNSSNLTGVSRAPLCRYQGYASRGSDPMKVFLQLYIAHKACNKSPKLVGVNIVSAENGENSMLYYDEHMQMFNYLRGAIKTPFNTSLHAGEMTIGLVKPEDLGTHICKAVTIAGADRIGHGVDLPFESSSTSLLQNMKKDKVAVEINLTSNEFILGVKDDAHPVMLYYKAGVPIVISTDDPGILRTNLVEQYMLLAMRYGLNYNQIKSLVNNSIDYSFMNDRDKAAQKDLLKANFSEFENQFVSEISAQRQLNVIE